MSNPNPFIIESALIEHLSAEIDYLKDVGSFGKYEAQVDKNDYPPLPSIYVMPDEAKVSDDTGVGFDVETQHWIVSILIGHSPDANDTDTTAIRAGAIMADVASALVGWQPTHEGVKLQGFKPMRYEGKDRPNYSAGFAEFVCVFSTGLVLTGNN